MNNFLDEIKDVATSTNYVAKSVLGPALSLTLKILN